MVALSHFSLARAGRLCQGAGWGRGTTTLTVTANTGHAITSVTGCGGTLSGSTYTTGAINAGCTVTASFAAARAAPFRWKDASGNVWLFGGYQYDDATNTRFEMNDLWVYPMQ